jgi:hypothetical protein
MPFEGHSGGVFTVSWRQTDREFALALGASEYIRKPPDLQVFSDVVCEMVFEMDRTKAR